jgi:hypothetical protein
MSACWEWKGKRNSGGYGFMSLPGKATALMHRAAYRLFVGEIPKGMGVLHRCDNPPCINPDHLWVGTDLDNHSDMVAKGRSLKGEKHNMVKLTEDQIQTIRRLRASGHSVVALASMFGVCHQHISGIVNRKKWGWLA